MRGQVRAAIELLTRQEIIECLTQWEEELHYLRTKNAAYWLLLLILNDMISGRDPEEYVPRDTRRSTSTNQDTRE